VSQGWVLSVDHCTVDPAAQPSGLDNIPTGWYVV
jgi:hypothetical protein